MAKARLAAGLSAAERVELYRIAGYWLHLYKMTGNQNAYNKLQAKVKKCFNEIDRRVKIPRRKGAVSVSTKPVTPPGTW